MNVHEGESSQNLRPPSAVLASLTLLLFFRITLAYKLALKFLGHLFPILILLIPTDRSTPPQGASLWHASKQLTVQGAGSSPTLRPTGLAQCQVSVAPGMRPEAHVRLVPLALLPPLPLLHAAAPALA